VPEALKLAGQRFVRLMAIEPVGSRGSTGVLWRCVCDCGNEAVVPAGTLRKGIVKSCGCLLRELAAKRCIAMNTSHGLSKIPEYAVWAAMLRRCRRPQEDSYARYGARGISVCNRWLDFANFIADMGRRPGYGWSLERINNDGNYEPGNVRWATAKEQARNRRTSSFLTFNGRTATIAEWCEITGLTQQQVSGRLSRQGWSVERTLTEPLRAQRRGLNEYQP
jgi:hypothetical protein